MEKKEYTAPKMEIVDFDHQVALLSGSGEEPSDTCDDGDYCDELG
ncbi:hypothetical protein [Fibrobacter sp. UWB10]|nr:hypothetical protein [Fibrobacter sp. UWB10]SMP57798.1 hypothetical protein SAMN05720465_2766 [Fibrobacter sp. UWB10]